MNKNEAMKVLRGISQAEENVRHGYMGTEGETMDVGMRRQKDDNAFTDGFQVKVVGDILLLKYHTLVDLKELHSSNFESDIETVMESILSKVKKEYRKETKESINLKRVGKIQKEYERMSATHQHLKAIAKYEVRELNIERNDGRPAVKDVRTSKERLEEGIRNWISGIDDARRS
jgi:hypothetical protein